MEFKTDRLILRPWQTSDAESLFQYAKDPQGQAVATHERCTNRTHHLHYQRRYHRWIKKKFLKEK